ncbi:hypothetical protein GCM10009347_07690 [Shewanella algicola]|nr:hypothetical protein GCM10009347_07690 [Shewanella algicola]
MIIITLKQIRDCKKLGLRGTLGVITDIRTQYGHHWDKAEYISTNDGVND